MKAALVLASLLAACAGPVASRDSLPLTFMARPIAAATQSVYRENLTDINRRRGSPKLTRFHILAWQRTDTHNPSVSPFEFSESCIAWSEFRHRDGTQQWLLSHLYSNRRGWEVQVVNDAPIPGSRVFGRRPTNQDVTAFMKDTWWLMASVQGEPGIIDAGICKRAWLDAIGASPPVVLSFAERPKSHARYY